MGVARQFDNALAAATVFGGDLEVTQGGAEVADTVAGLFLHGAGVGCLGARTNDRIEKAEAGDAGAGLQKMTTCQTRDIPTH
jgi:hypothetical protein